MEGVYKLIHLWRIIWQYPYTFTHITFGPVITLLGSPPINICMHFCKNIYAWLFIDLCNNKLETI